MITIALLEELYCGVEIAVVLLRRNIPSNSTGLDDYPIGRIASRKISGNVECRSGYIVTVSA